MITVSIVSVDKFLTHNKPETQKTKVNMHKFKKEIIFNT